VEEAVAEKPAVGGAIGARNQRKRLSGAARRSRVTAAKAAKLAAALLHPKPIITASLPTLLIEMHAQPQLVNQGAAPALAAATTAATTSAKAESSDASSSTKSETSESESEEEVAAPKAPTAAGSASRDNSSSDASDDSSSEEDENEEMKQSTSTSESSDSSLGEEESEPEVVRGGRAAPADASKEVSAATKVGRPRHLQYLSEKAVGQSDETSKDWKKPYEVIAAIGMNAEDSANDLSAYMAVEGNFSPKTGDVIAFQEMSLNEDTFTVELTSYKYARVLAFVPETMTAKVVIASSLPKLKDQTKSKRPKKNVQYVEVQNLANVRLVEGPSREECTQFLPRAEDVAALPTSTRAPALKVSGKRAHSAETTDANSSDAYPHVPIETVFNPQVGDSIIFQTVTLCLETFQPVQTDDKFAMVLSTERSTAQLQVFATLEDLKAQGSKKKRNPNAFNSEAEEVIFEAFTNVRLISGPSRDDHDKHSAALAKVRAENFTKNGEDLFALLALKKQQVHAKE
jgi:hypothetical protein